MQSTAAVSFCKQRFQTAAKTDIENLYSSINTEDLREVVCAEVLRLYGSTREAQ